jgi:hypothetical protein
VPKIPFDLDRDFGRKRLRAANSNARFPGGAGRALRVCLLGAGYGALAWTVLHIVGVI